jgi:hypothetical protein
VLEPVVPIAGAVICLLACLFAFSLFKGGENVLGRWAFGLGILLVSVPVLVYCMVRFIRWGWDTPIPFTH